MSSVSVVIPCYKYAHFLESCVRTVLDQPGVDVEIMIVDDCSPDNTTEVAETLMKVDRRVHYMRHEVNKRHIATYNDGLEWASGDYTLVLSADDLLTPGALKRAADILDQHPEVGFVYGPIIKFSKNEERPEPRNPAHPDYTITKGLDWVEARCQDGWSSYAHALHSPECVTRTSIGKMIGGFRPELPVTGDLELWTRFAVHSDVVYINNADQAYYRVHGANMHIGVQKDPLAETLQTRLAFDFVFDKYGHRIPELDRFRRTAYESMAKNALRLGCNLFDSGAIESKHLPQFVEFAKEMHFHTGVSPEYFKVWARQVLGPRLYPLIRTITGRG